jgi:hypothetical protein
MNFNMSHGHSFPVMITLFVQSHFVPRVFSQGNCVPDPPEKPVPDVFQMPVENSWRTELPEFGAVHAIAGSLGRHS